MFKKRSITIYKFYLSICMQLPEFITGHPNPTISVRYQILLCIWFEDIYGQPLANISMLPY